MAGDHRGVDVGQGDAEHLVLGKDRPDGEGFPKRDVRSTTTAPAQPPPGTPGPLYPGHASRPM